MIPRRRFSSTINQSNLSCISRFSSPGQNGGSNRAAFPSRHCLRHAAAEQLARELVGGVWEQLPVAPASPAPSRRCSCPKGEEVELPPLQDWSHGTLQDLGRMTVSITWITPFSASTSVFRTFAPLTVTPASATMISTVCPCTVLASIVFTSAAMTLPERTW